MDPVQETTVIILFPIKLMFSNKIVNFGVLADNTPVQIDQIIFKFFTKIQSSLGIVSLIFLGGSKSSWVGLSFGIIFMLLLIVLAFVKRRAILGLLRKKKLRLVLI